MNSPAKVDEVAQLILNYLETNTDAGDTLEGIVKWWVLRQQLTETMSVVQQALDKLKAEGIIIERQSADRKTLYLLKSH